MLLCGTARAEREGFPMQTECRRNSKTWSAFSYCLQLDAIVRSSGIPGRYREPARMSIARREARASTASTAAILILEKRHEGSGGATLKARVWRRLSHGGKSREAVRARRLLKKRILAHAASIA